MTKRQRTAAIEDFFDHIADYKAEFAECGIDIERVKQRDLHMPLNKLKDKDEVTKAIAIVKICAIQKVRYGR